jgi:hypothetical protein
VPGLATAVKALSFLPADAETSHRPCLFNPGSIDCAQKLWQPEYAMSLYPAQTLEAVWLACDPDQPLQPDDPRYVDLNAARCEDDMAACIGWEIHASEQSQSAQFLHKLVTGHRGSGKSTELLRLRDALNRAGFLTIYLDAEDVLDPGDVCYQDVLLAIAQSLGAALAEHKIEVDDTILEALVGWFNEKVLVKSDETSRSAAVGASGEASAGLPFLGKFLAKITSELKSGSSTREEIRENVDRNLSQFLTLLRYFVINARLSVRQQGKKNIVILFDGLEKTTYRETKDGISNHFDIFIHHADQLKSLDCHIVYTLPIALAFKAQLGDAWPAGYYLIPMVKLRDRQGNDWPTGREALWEVIRRRVAVDTVFETPDTVDDFITLSGGAVRDMLRLVRLACGPRPSIGKADGAKAIAAFLRHEDRLIPEERKDQLARVAADKRVPNACDFEQLLHNRLIHEYQNGDRWADVHPAVKLLLGYDDRPTLKTYSK